MNDGYIKFKLTSSPAADLLTDPSTVEEFQSCAPSERPGPKETRAPVAWWEAAPELTEEI